MKETIGVLNNAAIATHGGIFMENMEDCNYR